MNRCCNRALILHLVAFSIWLTGFNALSPALAGDEVTEPVDRFAGEPKRPKARVPIRFLESFPDARNEAARTGRPILAYFTGSSCGWCRVMEKRTLNDAEVVELSRRFVCIKLDSEKEPRLADELAVDAIPRSFILTSAGAQIDVLPGYIPAAEYAEWMRIGVARPAHKVPIKAASTPIAVGATGKEAGLLIWFVDGPRGMKRWAEPRALEHRELMQILLASGASPRVEHLAFSDFPSRWDQARANARLPDIIASEKLPAMARDLEKRGELLSVISQRLSWTPGLASCPDFSGRMLHVRQAGLHDAVVMRGLELILGPGPETELAGPRLLDAADLAKAEDSARRALVSYMSGDASGLREVACASSPQLNKCTKSQEWRKGLAVRTGSIEIRGGSDLVFAKVEVFYRGSVNLGADPYLIVLVREMAGWRAFAITSGLETWKWLPDVLGCMHPKEGALAPETPRLDWPIDRALLPDFRRPLTWQTPEGKEKLVAELCMLMGEEVGGNNRGESWPYATLVMGSVHPGGGSIPSGQHDPGRPTRWCVCAIGIGGRMAVSEVRSYDLKKSR